MEEYTIILLFGNPNLHLIFLWKFKTLDIRVSFLNFLCILLNLKFHSLLVSINQEVVKTLISQK